VRAEGEAIVGRNVHLCARIMQRAAVPELWVSDDAKVALEVESPGLASGISWIARDDCELSGIPGRHSLWRAAESED